MISSPNDPMLSKANDRAFHGPWADWDESLADTPVYFPVDEYPAQKQATEEMRRLLVDVDETDLTPGHPQKRMVLLCGEGCEEICSTKAHQVEVECWVYQPRPRRSYGPPLTMRCPACRLLCLTSARTIRCYAHSAFMASEGRLGRCPGSGEPALNPTLTPGPGSTVSTANDHVVSQANHLA